MQQDVIIAINGAMQTLQERRRGLFHPAKALLTLGLERAFIRSLEFRLYSPGPAEHSIPLRALESRGEIDQFDRIFLGGTDYVRSPARRWRTGSSICAKDRPATSTGQHLAGPSDGSFRFASHARSRGGRRSHFLLGGDLATMRCLPISQNYGE